MRFLIIFIFLLTSSIADETTDIKNLIINKELKKYDSITFLDIKNNELNLNDYRGNLILLNFWATWCGPCKEEMPSLDRLQVNQNLSNLKIFAINISQESKKKVDGFFKDFGIKNFDPYYDAPITLAKTFSSRGVPTTILINKDGKEFSRIFGSIDFDNKNFIEWLKTYN